MSVNANHAAQAHSSGRAYLLLTMTTFCWGANSVFGRLAVGQISPMLLVSLRWLGSVILLLLVSRRNLREDWPTLRRHLPFLAVMGIVGFTTFNALFYVAAHYTTAVNMGIIQGSLPMFVLLGAFLAYRTPVTGLQAAGVALTMIGVVIVGTGGSLARLAALRVNRGDVLMVIACAFYAGYAVGLRRRPAVSALGLFTVIAGAAFLASIPLAIGEAAIGQLQWPTITGWIVLALVIVFPSFLAQIWFIQGVALIGPGRAGMFINLVPVFASILAVAVLDEPFRTFHAVALAFVLGGIWLAERTRRARI